MRKLLRSAPKFRMLFLTPALALLCLTAWALASPMGGSTDDDYHLVSTWCAEGSSPAECKPGVSPETRIVPEALELSPCFAGNPTISGACQDATFDLDPEPTQLTDRGNFRGSYPPVYYSFMNRFVGPNILLSVIVMRLVNALLFIGLTSVLFALLPRERRPVLIWEWVLCTVPLGLFLITSNNPSAWAIIGVGSAWLALLGYFETVGRRRLGLASVFSVSILMAAGSRADSAAYSVIAIGAVLILAFEPTKRFLRLAILPLAGSVVAILFFVSSRQTLSGFTGFSGSANVNFFIGDESVPVERSPLGLFFSNFVNVPSLWAGIFGSYPLGWFDTPVPEVVFLGALACFVAVVFRGIGSGTLRKSLVLAGIAVVLWALPLYVLQRGMDSVGQEVQPRYLLPLIVVLAGAAMLTRDDRKVQFSRPQWIILASTLSVAQSVALYFTLRRFVNGNEPGGFYLDSNIEWWWDIPFSPLFVMGVGSLAYTGLVFVLLQNINQPEFERSPDQPRETAKRQRSSAHLR